MITYQMFEQRMMSRITLDPSEGAAYLTASYVLYGKGIRIHVTEFLQEHAEYSTAIDWNVPEWLESK